MGVLERNKKVPDLPRQCSEQKIGRNLVLFQMERFQKNELANMRIEEREKYAEEINQIKNKVND